VSGAAAAGVPPPPRYARGTKEPLTRQGRERTSRSRRPRVRPSVRPITALYECTKTRRGATPSLVGRPLLPLATIISISPTAYDNRALARAAGCRWRAEWGERLPIGAAAAHKYMDMIQVRTRIISGPAHQTRLPSAGCRPPRLQAQGCVRSAGRRRRALSALQSRTLSESVRTSAEERACARWEEAPGNEPRAGKREDALLNFLLVDEPQRAQAGESGVVRCKLTSACVCVCALAVLGV
jgi:hypothetical protein